MSILGSLITAIKEAYTNLTRPNANRKTGIEGYTFKCMVCNNVFDSREEWIEHILVMEDREHTGK